MELNSSQTVFSGPPQEWGEQPQRSASASTSSSPRLPSPSPSAAAGHLGRASLRVSVTSIRTRFPL